MFKMNKKMSELYSKSEFKNNRLDPTLLEIVESGFYSKDGCFFIKKCMNIETNASVYDFPDKTGYECFINSINIDDYVSCNFLLEGIMLVKHIFHFWKNLKEEHVLVAILMLDEWGMKVKFHVQRQGEQWLSDKLDEYEEAIIVVDSLEEQWCT